MDTAKSSKPKLVDFTFIVKGKRLLATASSSEELMPFLAEYQGYRPGCEFTIEPIDPVKLKKGAKSKHWQKDHCFSLWQTMPKPDNSALDD